MWVTIWKLEFMSLNSHSCGSLYSRGPLKSFVDVIPWCATFYPAPQNDAKYVSPSPFTSLPLFPSFPILPLFFSSLISSSLLSHSSPLLFLIPANQSWTYLWRIIQVVLIKEDFFCELLYLSHVHCLNQMDFLFFTCSLHRIIFAKPFLYLAGISWPQQLFVCLFLITFPLASDTSSVRFLVWILSPLTQSVLVLGPETLLPSNCYLWPSAWSSLLWVVPFRDPDQDGYSEVVGQISAFSWQTFLCTDWKGTLHMEDTANCIQVFEEGRILFSNLYKHYFGLTVGTDGGKLEGTGHRSIHVSWNGGDTTW